MTKTRLLLLLCFTVAPAACYSDGAVDLGENIPEPAVPLEPTPMPLSNHPDCTPPNGDRLWAWTLEETRAALHGTWRLCSGLGLFSLSHAGVFIGPDDRYVLLEEVEGVLIPKAGLENKGQLSYHPVSAEASPDGLPYYVVNYDSDLGHSVHTGRPVFSDVPRFLLVNNAGYHYRYAAVR